MVCVPCFIIPVLLVIWRLFIQPILLRFWNPWEKKDEKGNVIKNGAEFPFQCIGGSCKFVGNKDENNQAKSTTNAVEVAADCKDTEQESKKEQ